MGLVDVRADRHCSTGRLQAECGASCTRLLGNEVAVLSQQWFLLSSDGERIFIRAAAGQSTALAEPEPAGAGDAQHPNQLSESSEPDHVRYQRAVSKGASWYGVAVLSASSHSVAALVKPVRALPHGTVQ